MSDIPEWDGNGDTILNWITKIDQLSYRNLKVYEDLGSIAPL